MLRDYCFYLSSYHRTTCSDPLIRVATVMVEGGVNSTRCTESLIMVAMAMAADWEWSDALILIVRQRLIKNYKTL